MIPADLHEFLIACVAAAASFIGLLFVGLSVVLQKTETDQALASQDRLLAESSFTALINIFFVTLCGLVPPFGVQYVMITMAVLGLLSSWRLTTLGHKTSIYLSMIVYVIELIFGIYYASHSNNTISIGWFEGVIVALFASGLLRAWGLTGIRANQSRRVKKS
jgi:hypothetical protein